MSEKARDLLFSSQQLTYQHKLLGDTMAVGSDWARVQMPNLGSPCVAFLPNHCHPTWPSTLLLGECATLFSMPGTAGWVCLQRLAQSLHLWARWAAGFFPQGQCTKEELETRLLSTQ